MQAVQQLFEILANLSHRERDEYLDAHPEISADAASMAKQLLAAQESSASLPPLARLYSEIPPIASTELHTGDWLGPYRLVRRVGSGGAGVVFEAVHEEGEICLHVAVKALHPELVSEEFLWLMHQEAAKLAKLHHPHIARLLDWKLDRGDAPYCVLEYIEGESITSWCSHHAPSRTARLQLFLEICSAVSFAHRNMIVHLDLKPENILVNTAGEVKLLDFGIARTLAADLASAGVPMRTYTARYASPEQIHGRPVSALSDIYSLGILLREIILDAETIKAQGKAGKALPHEIEAISARASASDPELRYATVEKLEQDLRRYLAGFPVRAMRQTMLYRASRFCLRNLKSLAVTLIIAVALAASITAWMNHLQEDREHRRAEQLRSSVHQLSSTLLFPLEDEMKDLPGATPARILAVNTGLQFLQNLSGQESKDPGLVAEIANAYIKLGDLQGNPSVANLGDFNGARASYEAARRLVSNRRDEEGCYVRGIALIHEADLADEEGDHRAATEMYEEAIGGFRELMRATHGAVRMESGLETALSDLADVQLASGMSDQARANYNQALDLARQIVRQLPRDLNSQRTLARCLSRQGDLEWSAGNWQLAYTAYRGSLDVVDRMLGQQPDNYRVRRSWIARANDLAAADEHLGRESEALDLYLRAEALATRNAVIDPQDTVAMRDQQIGYSNMTRVYLGSNHLVKAEKACRRGLALAQTLLKLNAQDATARDDLSGSEEQMAELQGKKHQYAAAISSEEDALRMLRANLQNSDSAGGVAEVMDGLVRLANYNLDLAAADPARAEAFRQAAIKSLTELRRLEPRLRPGYAEDKECAAKVRELEARLRSR